MTDLQDRLRADLMTARKARDTAATSVLRSTLAAIANAEAQPAEDGTPPMEGPIAGAAAGVGATDVARRELSDGDVEQVVRDQLSELVTAAELLEANGRPDDAAGLRRQAALLNELLA